METKDKIYWNGFIRQLKELYYLLSFEKYITTGSIEFISHFTGKKWRDEERSYTGKIKWEKEKYLLILLIEHLLEKKFLNWGSPNECVFILKKHFKDITNSDVKEYLVCENKPGAKKLKRKLNCLFPQNSGYRCKERIFYKIRNKEPESVILKNCGVDIIRMPGF